MLTFLGTCNNTLFRNCSSTASKAFHPVGGNEQKSIERPRDDAKSQVPPIAVPILTSTQNSLWR